MLGDILIALVITVIAIVLGITVHPILFFVVVLAVIYLFARVRLASLTSTGASTPCGIVSEAVIGVGATYDLYRRTAGRRSRRIRNS